MAEIPTFHTARLTLRAFHESDVDDALLYHSREDVTRYIPWPNRTREQVVEAIGKYMVGESLDKDGDAINFAMVLTTEDRPVEGRVIGQVLLIRSSVEHRGMELGYALHPDFAGQGYVAEAARELLRWAFTDHHAHRVAARIDARNTASAAVARKLGMQQEAHLRRNEFFKGDWSDELIFAILDDEWPASAGYRADSA